MSVLSYGELESYWIQAGGSSTLAPLMAAVALAESSGNPDSVNRTDNGGTQTSWGLWQISNGDHSEPAPNWNDPLENAKLAVGKYKSQGLGAWGTYTSGAYRKYLQGGVSPVPVNTGGGGGGGSGTGTDVTVGVNGFLSGLGSPITDFTGSLLSVPKEVVAWFADTDQMVAKLYDAFLLLFLPSTWIRVGSGFFGFIFLLAGMVLLIREAKGA